MSTPIYDQMVSEQFEREVDEYVARFEPTDTALTREHESAERDGNPLVAASFLAAVGIVLGLILAVIL